MTPIRGNWKSHELPVRATNGAKFLLRVENVFGIIISRLFIVTLGLFCFLIAVADPLIFQLPQPLPIRVAYWYLNGGIATLFWVAQFAVLAMVWRRFSLSFAVPSALLLFTSVASLVLTNYWLAAKLMSMPELWEKSHWSEIIRYTVVSIVFEVLLAVFLVPAVLEKFAKTKAVGAADGDEITRLADRQNTPQSEPNPTAVPRIIHHKGHTFEIETLLFMRSVEHYVEMVMHEGSELIRASLRELTEDLHPSQGIQPHRSYWVHRDAVDGMKRENGSQFLLLKNGAEIPISRHRKAEVSGWVAEHYGS